jgi:hypothetical protein
MANFLAKIIGSGIGGLAEQIGGIVDRFKMTPDEKAAFTLELEKLAAAATSELEQTMRTELQTKERILVAELTQGDTYTKRARPTVVYGGLVFIAFNYSIAPLFNGMMDAGIPELTLPSEFWYAWGGIVATWSVGRTMERRGVANNLVKVVTGSNHQKTPTLLGD